MIASIVHGLEIALAHGGDTHSVEDVLDQIERGAAQVWIRDGSLIVTEIHDYPQKKVLHFWLATGEIASVVSLSHRILAEGKKMGCVQATLAGRKGWERVLGADGWNPMLRVMSKEIQDG